MIKIKRDMQAKAPKLALDNEVKERIAKACLGQILKNIKDQVQADGQALKANALSTMRRKQEKGTTVNGISMSLVDEKHRFTRPSNWDSTWDRDGLKIAPGSRGGDPPLDELVEKVQEQGYTGWFAVGKKGLAAVQRILKDFIKKSVNGKA